MTTVAVQVLHEHGYRATPQRLLVLDAVAHLRHATPEQILTHIHHTSPAVNLSTVYRVLQVLDDVGLVMHAHIGTGSATYHVTDAPAHLHFRCAGCGRVQSLPAEVAVPFVEAIRARIGFRADVTHAGIDGRCLDCATPEEP